MKTHKKFSISIKGNSKKSILTDIFALWFWVAVPQLLSVYVSWQKHNWWWFIVTFCLANVLFWVCIISLIKQDNENEGEEHKCKW
jgi:hypothetical protein